MKHKGSVSDFSAHRDNELKASYCRQLKGAGGKVLSAEMIYNNAVKARCPRFWISEQRAVAVVSRMMKGDEMKDSFPEKRRMYGELHARVSVLMEACPGKSLHDAVDEVVNSEAPEFYMTAENARKILRRVFREMRARREGGHE